MTRGIEERLRKLEAANAPPRVRMVWSNTSNPAEWDRRIAELIASGEASPRDEFLRIGWMPVRPTCVEDAACGWANYLELMLFEHPREKLN